MKISWLKWSYMLSHQTNLHGNLYIIKDSGLGVDICFWLVSCLLELQLMLDPIRCKVFLIGSARIKKFCELFWSQHGPSGAIRAQEHCCFRAPFVPTDTISTPLEAKGWSLTHLGCKTISASSFQKPPDWKKIFTLNSSVSKITSVPPFLWMLPFVDVGFKSISY